MYIVNVYNKTRDKTTIYGLLIIPRSKGGHPTVYLYFNIWSVGFTKKQKYRRWNLIIFELFLFWHCVLFPSSFVSLFQRVDHGPINSRSFFYDQHFSSEALNYVAVASLPPKNSVCEPERQNDFFEGGQSDQWTEYSSSDSSRPRAQSATQPFLVSSRNAPPHKWGGALRDDSKNGCVADYLTR